MNRCVVLLSLGFIVAGCKPADEAVSDLALARDDGPEAVLSADTVSSMREAVERVETLAEERSWPEGYRVAVEMRLQLEQYSVRAHRMPPDVLVAAPRPLPRVRPGQAEAIRAVESTLSPEVLRYRRSFGEKVSVFPGFRAPVLEAAGEFRNPVRAHPAAPGADEEVGRTVRERLGRDGVMRTLVQALEVMGAAERADAAKAVQRLERLGFPIDWLACFPVTSGRQATPAEVVVHWSARLAGGESSESMRDELRRLPFLFEPSRAGLSVATESGDQEIGLFRTQIGGGYRDGIIPGGILDVSAQLAARMPQVDFLMSVPSPMFDDFRRMAETRWHLMRAEQLVLVREPFSVAGWPQDNGKAGVVRDGSGPLLATLIPRYASVGEVPMEFVPGESFLCDGLQAAGHLVVQSPLLFQGGNLLTVYDSAAKRRVLLLSEATVYKNTALGLTPAQVTEAFAREFGVQECVVLPSVSHHLDFDVSVRNHNGETIAFVNDTAAAVRLILAAGINALEGGGVLDAEGAGVAREDLEKGRDRALYGLLAGAVRSRRVPGTEYPSELARNFSAYSVDAGGPNLQSFLTALDFLGGRVVASGGPDGLPDAGALGLYSRVEERSALQRERLAAQGWKVVAIPSLPDIGVPVNYLNGIHDRSAFLMPVHGGFYSSLDRAAAEAFSAVLGPEVRLIPIETAACQQLQHGAVHCAAVAYPRLSAPRKSGT